MPRTEEKQKSAKAKQTKNFMQRLRKEGSQERRRKKFAEAYLGLRKEGWVFDFHPLCVDLGWLRIKLTANIVLARTRDILHTSEKKTTAKGQANQVNVHRFIQSLKADTIRRKFFKCALMQTNPFRRCTTLMSTFWALC